MQLVDEWQFFSTIRKTTFIAIVILVSFFTSFTTLHADDQKAKGLEFSSVAYAQPTPFNDGTYRAIAIGSNEYKDPKGVWSKLNTAVSDANAVVETLKKDYGFEDVVLLLNATRREILGTFNEIAKRTKKNDSVLIYYAGHGYQNEETDEAFWIPTDAQGWEDAFFLSNVRIKEKLSVISARASHTLLVSDSCFSGSLLRGGNRGISKSERTERYFRKISKRKSVQILAAGGLEYVDDNYENSGHSPFTYFFLKELKENTEKYLTSTALSNNLKRLVANNVQQTPQSGVLYGAGDEGGEFIFKRVKISAPAISVKPEPPGLVTDPKVIELSYWESIKDSNSTELFTSYLNKYPEGSFVDIAKFKINQLQAKTKIETKSSIIDDFLQQAEVYFNQGYLVSPQNRNARDQWHLALSTDPTNKKAKQGLVRIVKVLAKDAERYMDNNDLKSARSSIQIASETDPNVKELRIAEKRLIRLENKSRKEKIEKKPVIPPPSF